MAGTHRRMRHATGWLVCLASVALALWLAPATLAAPGDLDPGFGSGGFVVTDLGSEDIERNVAVDSLGRVLVVGNRQVSASELEAVVVRYTASGALDPAFGGDGIVQLDFEPGPWDDAAAVAIDGSGRIVVAGQTASDPACTSYCYAAIARLTADGALDPTFGGNGTVTNSVSLSNASAVAIDAGERIVVGGGSSISRYTASGAPDPTFSGDGTAPIDLFLMGLALDGNGRIVASGYSDGNVPAARLLANGQLDPTFDGNGYAVRKIAPGSWDYPNAMAVDGSGRVLVAGLALLPGETQGRLFALRFTPSGELDPTFGGGGIVLGNPNSWANGVAVDDSERPLLVGYWPGLGVFGDLLVRLRANGVPDPSFGTGGAAPVPFLASDVTTDGAQRIVVAGSDFGSDSDFAVARYLGGDAAQPEGPSQPATPIGDGQPSDPPHRPRPAVAPGIAQVIGGRALLRLRCPAQTACRGVAKLIARVQPERDTRPSAARARNVVIGRSRFRVPAGKTNVVYIRLNGRGKRLLRQAGRRGLRARLVGRGLRSRTVRLKPAKVKRPDQARR